MTDFEWADWIRIEREKQGLSMAQLGKKAKVSRQVIYLYESYQRKNPDPVILTKISSSLGYPPTVIFQKAGILPTGQDMNAEMEIVNSLFEQLKDPENKKRAQDYLRFLLTQEEQDARGKQHENGKSPKPMEP